MQEAVLDRFTINSLTIFKIDPKVLSDNYLIKYASFINDYNTKFYHPISVSSLEEYKITFREPIEIHSRLEHYVIESEGELVGFVNIRYFLMTDKNMIAYRSYLNPKYTGELDIFKHIVRNLPDEIEKIEMNMRREFNISPVDEFFMKNGKLTFTDRMSGAQLSQFNKSDIHDESIKLQKIAKEKGFSFTCVENGDYSSIDYPQYLKLVETIWNDMPKEDGDWEDEVVTEELHRSFYARVDKLHQTFFTIIASKGDIQVGHTQTYTEEGNSKMAWQDDTGVLKEFRGNNLGLTLKMIMLDKILNDTRFKNAEFWVTGNAASNAPMIRINNILKYEELVIRLTYSLSRKIAEQS